MDVTAQVSRKHVLLDYDDTLGLTEVVALGAACDLVNEIIRDLNSKNGSSHSEFERDDFIARFPGTTFRHILESIGRSFGVEFEPAQLDSYVQREKAGAIAALRRELKPTVGSETALTVWHGTNPLAVVSSSAPDRLRACLEATDQIRFIPLNRVYSAQTPGVPMDSKPAPDVYLHAMRDLNVLAQDCVAFEDSLSGARSAIAAGIPVVGVVCALPQEKQVERALKLLDAGVECVIDDMRYGPGIVADLERGDKASFQPLWGREAWERKAGLRSLAV